jgi:hypothetical protein
VAGAQSVCRWAPVHHVATRAEGHANQVRVVLRAAQHPVQSERQLAGHGHFGHAAGAPKLQALTTPPQLRIEAVDFRKGIDGLARVCQEKLQSDLYSHWLFVFRNRRGTAMKALTFDGRGFLALPKAFAAGSRGGGETEVGLATDGRG